MIPLVTIAHAGDLLAARVHILLERRFGAASARFLNADHLGAKAVWRHGLVRGTASSSLEFPGTPPLADDKPFLLFNRIRRVAMPHFLTAGDYDHSYAVAEMHALLLSWLHSLGARVQNPPSPPDLCGRDYSRPEALHAAARAGLETASYAFSSGPRSFPVDGAFRFQRLESSAAMPGRELAPLAFPAAGQQPTVASDCDLADEIGVVAAGRHRTRPGIPLSEDALARLQAAGGHAIMELRLAPCAAGGWKVSHVRAFPEQDDWEAATVIADFLSERAESEKEP